jgi:hypothetical protein
MGIALADRSHTREHPLLQLPEEDLDFIVQFVLTSGSLKEMATIHGVSYPTIRNTLDRTISNLQQRLNGTAADPMTDLLANMLERGEIKTSTAKAIRAVYRNILEDNRQNGRRETLA